MGICTVKSTTVTKSQLLIIFCKWNDAEFVHSATKFVT